VSDKVTCRFDIHDFIGIKNKTPGEYHHRARMRMKNKLNKKGFDLAKTFETYRSYENGVEEQVFVQYQDGGD